MSALAARPAAGAPGLAEALRLHVRTLHARAERSGVVSDILHGRGSAAGYALLLRNLLPAYEALENLLRRQGESPALRGIARPEVYRSAAITADLRRISPAWREELPVLPEAGAYAARVQACGGDAGRLLAHAYTRYLGDLSGGMVLERILPPAPDGGTWEFHQFAGIADVTAFKLAFRAAIDDAGAAVTDWPTVLDEAAAAFACNIAVSRAVKDALGRGQGVGRGNVAD